jgi:hypothetical protein
LICRALILKKNNFPVEQYIDTFQQEIKKDDFHKNGDCPSSTNGGDDPRRIIALDSQNRNELFKYILEVEQFIQQIKNEENKELVVKKPIHIKRIKNWNDILIQIKDKMYTKDYIEFIKIYNNPNFHSEYFKGFEGLVENFKKLNNREKYDDLLKYIAEITNRSIEQIKRDFSLID